MKSGYLSALLTAVCFILLPAAGFADGFIVVPPEEEHPVTLRPTPFPLEVKYHHVTVRIQDQTAVTSIDQVFYNPGERVLEGEYIFPVPKGAVIKNFSMYIDGKETHAELLDAEKARHIYEEIVRKTYDPALLEYKGTNLFRVRIFPIEPRKEKRVKISYSEILSRDGATTEYVYPLNTEKFSSSLLASVSVTVDLESREKIKNVYSTTHAVDVVRKGENKVRVSWEAHNAKPDTDFKLYFSLSGGEFQASFLPFREKGEEGFFFLDVSPGFWDTRKAKVPKNVTFVLDVSGSMAGEKLDKAKGALLYCLSRLEPEDRFALVRFSTEADALFERIVPADASHLAQARTFVNSLVAVGGTNIEQALSVALALNTREAPDAMRVSVVVFITDGKPTIGETDPGKLAGKIQKANPSRLRIFTVGIDESLDTILIDKLTSLTRAWRTYISPREDIELKISSFYQKIEAPVLANVSLAVDGGVRLFDTHPTLSELPDLFLGTSLTLLGRYRGSGPAVLTLTGTAGGTPVTLTYKINFPEEAKEYDTVPPLWASRRVGFLLEQIRIAGESRELFDEIIRLARTYGIITPYTSYLILEDETDRITRNELSQRDSTLRNLAPAESAFEEQSKREFAKLKAESGSSGVTTSDDLQNLRDAKSNDVAKSTAPRLNARDGEGREIDIRSQVKNANGRAFYNSGAGWTDSAIQKQKSGALHRIRFASEEYFSLTRKKPESNAYLALGRNVRFLLDGDLYEIYE